jgi:hypothetical protein
VPPATGLICPPLRDSERVSPARGSRTSRTPQDPVQHHAARVEGQGHAHALRRRPRDADGVVTATMSREPIFDGATIGRGAHGKAVSPTRPRCESQPRTRSSDPGWCWIPERADWRGRLIIRWGHHILEAGRNRGPGPCGRPGSSGSGRRTRSGRRSEPLIQYSWRANAS